MISVSLRSLKAGRAVSVLTVAALFLTAGALAFPFGGEASSVSSIDVRLVPLGEGEFTGTELTEDGIRLGLSLENVPAYQPYQRAGLHTGQPIDAQRPIVSVLSTVTGTAADESTVEFEIRGSQDGVTWTGWMTPSSEGVVIFPISVRFIQHRLTLLANADSPTVSGIEFGLIPGPATVSAFQTQANPTVRVFGSREGLVGRTTANGQLIRAADRFVALPSKKVLNSLGKQDYKVRITYQDRTVEAPVWDIGPWNIKDNYWDADRESFGDLPRFMPQSYAAWADNHNGGKDGSGRWVSFPSAIDISDGAFVDDLKLTTSTWVDVTFLWIDAQSPPRGPAPPVLGLKPQGSKGMQPTSANGNLPASPIPSSPVPTAVPGELVRAVAATPTPVPVQASSTEPVRAILGSFASVPVDGDSDSWIALQNTTDQTASAALVFIRGDGQRDSRPVTVAANGRLAVRASQVESSGDYGVVVESDRPLVMERSTFFGQDGLTTSASLAPSRVWMFPEGTTESPRETLLLVRNSSNQDARATLTLVGDSGRLRSTDLRIARGARAVVNLAESSPVSGAVSSILESDQPLLAERITYMNDRTGGDGGTGSTAGAASWYFADANTVSGTDCWLVILNPADADATVQLRIFGDNGAAGDRTYTVPAQSRRAVFLNQETSSPSRFGMLISSDVPVVAERTEYWSDGGVATGSMSIIGATQQATSWAFPEGTSSGNREWLSVLNAGDLATTARLELVGERGRVSSRDVTVPPQSRISLDLTADMAETALSARITADRPVTVERQIRLNGGRGGTGSSGVRL